MIASENFNGVCGVYCAVHKPTLRCAKIVPAIKATWAAKRLRRLADAYYALPLLTPAQELRSAYMRAIAPPPQAVVASQLLIPTLAASNEATATPN